MKDMMSNVNPVVAIPPQVATTDAAMVSAALDTLGAMSITFLIALGTLADAAATFAVLLQECDTSGGTYTDVADGDLIGTEALAGFTEAADGGCRKLGYRGVKRYLKLTITPTGNAAAAPVAAIMLVQPLRVPAANPPV